MDPSNREDPTMIITDTVYDAAGQAAATVNPGGQAND